MSSVSWRMNVPEVATTQHSFRSVDTETAHLPLSMGAGLTLRLHWLPGFPGIALSLHTGNMFVNGPFKLVSFSCPSHYFSTCIPWGHLSVKVLALESLSLTLLGPQPRNVCNLFPVLNPLCFKYLCALAALARHQLTHLSLTQDPCCCPPFCFAGKREETCLAILSTAPQR